MNLAYQEHGQIEASGDESCFLFMTSLVGELKKNGVAHNSFDLDSALYKNTSEMLKKSSENSGKFSFNFSLLFLSLALKTSNKTRVSKVFQFSVIQQR